MSWYCQVSDSGWPGCVVGGGCSAAIDWFSEPSRWLLLGTVLLIVLIMQQHPILIKCNLCSV